MGREVGASLNPWWWTVLTLLHERSMHPYEIQRLTAERGKDFLVEHKPGSLYSVIERLRRDGLIAEQAITRSGKLPERTVYRITEHGRQAFLDWLHRQLAHPPERDLPSFAFALEKIAHLDPDRVAALLSQRVVALRQQIGALEQILADAATRDIAPVSLLEIDYARAIRQAELSWLQNVLDELSAGRLRWNPPQRSFEDEATAGSTTLPENRIGTPGS